MRKGRPLFLPYIPLDPIVQDDDLEDMYRSYEKCREVILWCIQPSNQPRSQLGAKRPVSETIEDQPKSKRGSCSQTLSIVEDIVIQLRDKHGKKYTTEQLNCWAHMYNKGKHANLESPPNLPFFLDPGNMFPRVMLHQVTLAIIVLHHQAQCLLERE